MGQSQVVYINGVRREADIEVLEGKYGFWAGEWTGAIQAVLERHHNVVIDGEYAIVDRLAGERGGGTVAWHTTQEVGEGEWIIEAAPGLEGGVCRVRLKLL